MANNCKMLNMCFYKLNFRPSAFSNNENKLNTLKKTCKHFTSNTVLINNAIIVFNSKRNTSSSSCNKNLIKNINKREKSNLTHDLIKWSIGENISFVSFARLLKILKSNNVENIPINFKKTLNNIENKFIIQDMPPDDNNFLNGDEINLKIFIDSFLISKKSNDIFWTILGSVNDLNSLIFMIGIYKGILAPNDSNLFLKQFVIDVQNLCTNGLIVNDRKYSVNVNRIICDAPAKSYVLNFKGCTGYSSCTKCTTHGEPVGSKVCFPTKSTLRTDDDFLSSCIYRNNIKTALLNIPNFGIVSKMPLDYMHLICLGVLKQLISLWDKNYDLKKSNVNLFNIIKSSPKEFYSKLKPFRAYNYWSPSLLREFLLYYGPIVMINVLSPELYQNFLHLHVACRILCMNDKKNLTGFADNILQEFILDFIKLYGKREVGHNVHGLYHLVDDYKLHGTLDDFSAFQFEKFLKKLQGLLKKSRKKSLSQLVIKTSLNDILEKSVKQYLNGNYVFDMQNTQNCPNEKLMDVNVKEYKEHKKFKLKGFEIILNDENDSYVILKNQKIVKVTNILQLKKTNDYFIVGKIFLQTFNFYNSPLNSNELQIFRVNNNNLSVDVKIWPIHMIERKCMKGNLGEGKNSSDPIPENVSNLVLDVMNDMKLNNDEINLVETIVVKGIDVKHFGILGFSKKLYLGIPKNYFYDDENKVTESEFKSILKNVNLDKISFEEEKILKKRVFISEKAKKYAIANEIYLSKHFTFYIQGIIFWIVGILSSMKLKLYNPKKHPSVAKHSYFFLLNFYGFYTMFCILSYKLLGSYKLSSADSYLASLGSDYVQGERLILKMVNFLLNTYPGQIMYHFP
ncbi:conserved hypothetical protein [Pediculus humanus corporis]|uniref:Uncharacterized protein n=1 Tax=Pediculus humanus subsp. corporis TaxID=121224 RepID=E0VXN2_PEDHC|nr:uncharacterized protein Phum_PHUM503140 [Pediculus humanus corporis]EEB18138.1 conserved hypothetical protein [Pediculus humanus corporis]